MSFCLVTVYFNLTVFSFCNPWALMFLEGLPVMIGFLDVTVTDKAKHSCLVPAILRSPAGPESVKINWTLDILKPRPFSAKSSVNRQKLKVDMGGQICVWGHSSIFTGTLLRINLLQLVLYRNPCARNRQYVNQKPRLNSSTFIFMKMHREELLIEIACI